MREIIVLRQFSYAEDGIHIEHYKPREKPYRVGPNCYNVALTEGWAKDAVEAPGGAPTAPFPVAGSTGDLAGSGGGDRGERTVHETRGTSAAKTPRAARAKRGTASRPRRK